ncbi:3-beta hydroxysteroid dehydrogenase [Bacillus salacetis]|uniref:3-beta hydroxysteroid dehydrogenase n=1 Tax=Bacillus salacetis TaxID=2315464 RepID=A0A3A1QSA0_9BACI|nr:SDR family oxidoreductase [Bacillus salacetis]RIW30176.1 3-beta hydroxysteroid dehydrogenase [Bacillus salacetis]
MANYFLTGFPGFIANELIIGLLKESDENVLYCLHLPSMKSKALAAAKKLEKEAGMSKKIILLEGDITQKGLGLEDGKKEFLKRNIDFVWHLAAIYDLSVAYETAYRVNVTGTLNMNHFCEELMNLKRYVYFSPAYIAGTRTGTLLETELERPESFHNHYEETKFEAEILVEEVKKRLPVTIIRPGIVKGKSDTGETSKFDGPYFIMNMFRRLSFLPVIPAIGDGESVVNIVPVEYIISASIYLGHLPSGEGKTYHLTDPHPYKVNDIYRSILWEMNRKKPIGRIPLRLASSSLKLAPVRKFLRVEREALDYFAWKGTFDCTATIRDLEPAGIVCTDFLQTVGSMVGFYKANCENPQYHVKVD